MLTLVAGDYRDFDSEPGFCYHLGSYFDAMYEDEWFLDDFAQRLLKDVDRIDLNGRGVAALWDLHIPPEWIAGGTKTLLCLKHTDRWTSLTRMGENCYKYLQEIAQHKDIRLAVTGPCFFSEEDLKYGPVFFERSQKLVYTCDDFAHEMILEVHEYVKN